MTMGRVGVSEVGSTWATEGSEFHFRYTEFKIQRGQAEKEIAKWPAGSIHLDRRKEICR